MGKAEGPESEVGGGVGDGSQTILDGVNRLVDEDLTKFKLQEETEDIVSISNITCLTL